MELVLSPTSDRLIGGHDENDRVEQEHACPGTGVICRPCMKTWGELDRQIYERNALWAKN